MYIFLALAMTAYGMPNYKIVQLDAERSRMTLYREVDNAIVEDIFEVTNVRQIKSTYYYYPIAIIPAAPLSPNSNAGTGSQPNNNY